jgi:Ohr subfamily peroxiredoxin
MLLRIPRASPSRRPKIRNRPLDAYGILATPTPMGEPHMKILYTAHATARGGRNGHSEASDGSVKADLSIPKEMGGPGKPNTTTPEHLFATGYAACFGSALEFVAKQKKASVDGATITAHVGIGQREGGGFGFAIEMEAYVPGHSQTEAEALVAAAHGVCPYSNALKGNVDVKLTTRV